MKYKTPNYLRKMHPTPLTLAYQKHNGVIIIIRVTCIHAVLNHKHIIYVYTVL